MYVGLLPTLGKGRTGSARMRSLQFVMLFDRGTCWVLPSTYFYIPRSARANLDPQSVKFLTFAAAPLVLTPVVRNQPPPCPRACAVAGSVCRPVRAGSHPCAHARPGREPRARRSLGRVAKWARLKNSVITRFTDVTEASPETRLPIICSIFRDRVQKGYTLKQTMFETHPIVRDGASSRSWREALWPPVSLIAFSARLAREEIGHLTLRLFATDLFLQTANIILHYTIYDFSI